MDKKDKPQNNSGNKNIMSNKDNGNNKELGKEQQKNEGDGNMEAFMTSNCFNFPTLEDIKSCIKNIIESHKAVKQQDFIMKLRKELEDVKFNYETFSENDGSYTFSLKDVDIVVNGRTYNETLNLLIEDLREYCQDYCDDLDYWYSDENRRSHIKYILKVLIYTNDELKKDFICQNGQN